MACFFSHTSLPSHTDNMGGTKKPKQHRKAPPKNPKKRYSKKKKKSTSSKSDSDDNKSLQTVKNILKGVKEATDSLRPGNKGTLRNSPGKAPHISLPDTSKARAGRALLPPSSSSSSSSGANAEATPAPKKRRSLAHLQRTPHSFVSGCSHADLCHFLGPRYDYVHVSVK
jgi:hypothetical protein